MRARIFRQLNDWKGSVTTMDDRKIELVRKLKDTGIANDPQWLDRLDEPAPLWVVLDLLLQLMERQDESHLPFD
ncbi:hypothetical protein FHS18_002493 [Paenibacillus phyllosphaerae]|uniref:Uncharacterized protein n=1 Tax=Paenibacillus phyllosphaerae TaxID=274593 RepID=A0A7W5FMM4_9BACL|nr:hypothetical protein [Paenibacillus phyllosphaerae]MBB3110426.1 hypothetical protein [Paenibacillus phyllosphaerae]